MQRLGRSLGRWLVVAIVATAATAGAQTQAPAPGSPFVIQSEDGDNLVQIDVLAHFDGRFALTDDDGAVIDTFAVRRLRPILQGRVLRRFEFYFNPDFGLGKATLFDAYVDTVFSDAFHLRFGKSKTPVGLERLILARALVFVERSLATSLTPNRDVGVQVLGDLAGKTISYAVSVGNGATDGASTDLESHDNKEVAARFVAVPLARRPSSAWRGLGVGIGASRGNISALPVFRTATLLQPFLTYLGASGDGTRVRVAPQAFYYHKAFSAFGEYVHSAQPIRRGEAAADIAHTAWNVTATYVLTGEAVTERAVRPHHNFDFRGGSLGAIQIAARYHALDVDEAAIALGLAAPGSSHKAEAFTAGVNWYLNPFIKYVLNYERTVFDDDPDGPRPAEYGVVFRAQLYF